MSSPLIMVLFSIAMSLGLLGVFLPLLPSLPYMLLVALVYGMVDKFNHHSLTEMIILTAIAVISVIVDYSSGIIAAKYGGASKSSLFYGVLGLVIGLIAFPPLGGLIGLFLAILISEILNYKKVHQALKAAASSLIGSVAGIIINFLLAIIFLILFVIFAL